MDRIKLSGTARTIGTKQDLKQLRRDGEVPCIIYGQGIENINFSISAKELKSITHTPKSYIIEVEVAGKTQLCIFHQAQYHPISDETLHVDFLAVSEDKPVVIDVPLNIFGNSEGVKQGGKLMVTSRKLKVCAQMDKLPNELPVDITALQLGKSIVAGELSYEGLQIVSNKNTIVCTVKMTRAALGAAAAAAAAARK